MPGPDQKTITLPLRIYLMAKKMANDEDDSVAGFVAKLIVNKSRRWKEKTDGC